MINNDTLRVRLGSKLCDFTISNGERLRDIDIFVAFAFSSTQLAHLELIGIRAVGPMLSDEHQTPGSLIKFNTSSSPMDKKDIALTLSSHRDCEQVHDHFDCLSVPFDQLQSGLLYDLVVEDKRKSLIDTVKPGEILQIQAEFNGYCPSNPNFLTIQELEDKLVERRDEIVIRTRNLFLTDPGLVKNILRSIRESFNSRIELYREQDVLNEGRISWEGYLAYEAHKRRLKVSRSERDNERSKNDERSIRRHSQVEDAAFHAAVSAVSEDDRSESVHTIERMPHLASNPKREDSLPTSRPRSRVRNLLDELAENHPGGFTFTKHSRLGKPKVRLVMVDMDKRVLSWGTPQKIQLRDITKVHLGKIAKDFNRRTAKYANPDLCFSLETLKGRTINFEADTVENRELWVNVMRALATKNSNCENSSGSTEILQ